jgi:glycosyltransferase involved in cell wall biosynthesis
MRVAILWTKLSGYLNACLKELASRENVELCVADGTFSDAAPFDDSQFTWIENRVRWGAHPDIDPLRRRLAEFSPQVMVICGWHIPAYQKLARAYRGKCVRVMTMDHPWRATFKQRVGTWVAPYHVRPIADLVWLPGERQAVFARKLGFDERVILRGLYTCDHDAFAAVHKRRLAASRPLANFFLYVGRFVAEKGLDTLVRAYQVYRENTDSPWPLICCGAGPQRSILEGRPGIRIEGFVQPADLPNLFGAAGCLVLPSVFEPWALVIHEAASAGLPVLASEMAGAAVHLVQPGYNGFIFGAGDAQGLAENMSRISAMSEERLDAMSRASFSLSQQYTPRRWADTILDAASCSSQAPRAHSDLVEAI